MTSPGTSVSDQAQQAVSAVNQAWRNQVDQLGSAFNEHLKTGASLQAEVLRLRGLVSERDKTIEDLQKELLDRTAERDYTYLILQKVTGRYSTMQVEMAKTLEDKSGQQGAASDRQSEQSTPTSGAPVPDSDVGGQ